MPDCISIVYSEFIIIFQDYAPENVLLYFDTAEQWDAVYKTDTVSSFSLYEPPHKQPNNLHRRKQSHRSAVQ